MSLETRKFVNMHLGISKLLFIYFRNLFLHLLLLFLTRSPGRCRSARFNPWDGWFARTTCPTFQTCTHITPHTRYTAYTLHRILQELQLPLFREILFGVHAQVSLFINTYYYLLLHIITYYYLFLFFITYYYLLQFIITYYHLL